MLPLVKTPTQKLEKYKGVVAGELLREIKKLTEGLSGLKMAMINSTPRGGGVAEVLKSLILLMKGLGLQVEWYTIPPAQDFFKITKEIHNALQGKEYVFPFQRRVKYLQHIKKIAALMQDIRTDIWAVHDPQPLVAIRQPKSRYFCFSSSVGL